MLNAEKMYNSFSYPLIHKIQISAGTMHQIILHNTNFWQLL